MNCIRTILNLVLCSFSLTFNLSLNAASISGNQTYTLTGYDPFIYVYDTSTLNMINSAGAAHVYANNQSTVNVDIASDVGFLNMRNDSTAHIYNGTVSWLNLYDNSQADIHKGTFSWLNLYGDSQANIYSGDFSWVQLYDNARINVYDLSTSWFLLGLNSHATIYGQNLTYVNGQVSGLSLDGMNSFSFQVLNMDDSGSILRGIPTNITLSQVPLPAPLILFISGLLFLFKTGCRKA